MAVNPYFNKYNNYAEQQLAEDLMIESIQMKGIDINYIPRRLQAFDEMLGEDQLSTYTNYYPIEVYVENVDGFGGDGQFLSKFNLEIRDQITFTISIKRFMQDIGTPESFVRPREGDIIHFPLSDGVFVIKYVETRPIFYMMGELQVYDMICEQFEYSDERFSTGIEVIDNIQKDFSHDVIANPNLNLDDEPDDYLSDNELFRSANTGEYDNSWVFDPGNPFGDP